MAVIKWVDKEVGMGWTGGNNWGHNGVSVRWPWGDMSVDTG